MSYDIAFICPSLDRSTWRYSTREEHVWGEVERHRKTFGNFVVLISEANFVHDELYCFENPLDAAEFYRHDFQDREFVSDVISYGFQEISLYLAGKIVATKNQAGQPAAAKEASAAPPEPIDPLRREYGDPL